MAAVMPDFKRPNRPVIVERISERVLREYDRTLPHGTVEHILCKRIVGLDDKDKAWKYITESAWVGVEPVRALAYGYFRHYESE